MFGQKYDPIGNGAYPLQRFPLATCMAILHKRIEKRPNCIFQRPVLAPNVIHLSECQIEQIEQRRKMQAKDILPAQGMHRCSQELRLFFVEVPCLMYQNVYIPFLQLIHDRLVFLNRLHIQLYAVCKNIGGILTHRSQLIQIKASASVRVLEFLGNSIGNSLCTAQCGTNLTTCKKAYINGPSALTFARGLQVYYTHRKIFFMMPVLQVKAPSAPWRDGGTR